jgi:hypothetical protein
MVATEFFVCVGIAKGKLQRLKPDVNFELVSWLPFAGSG